MQFDAVWCALSPRESIFPIRRRAAKRLFDEKKLPMNAFFSTFFLRIFLPTQEHADANVWGRYDALSLFILIWQLAYGCRVEATRCVQDSEITFQLKTNDCGFGKHPIHADTTQPAPCAGFKEFSESDVGF